MQNLIKFFHDVIDIIFKVLDFARIITRQNRLRPMLCMENFLALISGMNIGMTGNVKKNLA